MDGVRNFSHDVQRTLLVRPSDRHPACVRTYSRDAGGGEPLDETSEGLLAKKRLQKELASKVKHSFKGAGLAHLF